MQNLRSPSIPNPPINDVPMLENNPTNKDIISNKLPSSSNAVNFEEDDDPTEQDLINLSMEELTCLYDPWKYFVIIKLVRKNFAHQYLKNKLEALWKPSRPLCLIDLELGFYTVKFENLESQAKSLQGRPWFISITFISVGKWEPNFVPSNAQHSGYTYSNFPLSSMTPKYFRGWGGKLKGF